MIETAAEEYAGKRAKPRDSSNNERDPFEQGPINWKSLPPWASILSQDSAQWKAARTATKGGPKVLITNAFGIDPSVTNLNTMLALALTLRGAEVHLLLCDQALPACWVSQIQRVEADEFAQSGPPRRMCGECYPGVNWVFQSLNLPLHRHSELTTQEDIETAWDISSKIPVNDIGRYHLNELPVGEHALSGALRFFARGDLEGEPHGEAILRRYFNAALQTVFATRRLMTMFPFTSVVIAHGMYIPEGIIGEVAHQQQARVATYSFGYRKRTCVFSHDRTYHHTLLSEPTSQWENLTWTPEIERETLGYLNSRRYGTRDWIRFIEDPQEDVAAIADKLGVDFSKPCIALLTNVVWDAQIIYPNNAFSNMMEWILESIRYFTNRPELQLIIRVHPGELLAHTRARQTVTGEIGRVFPSLPKNVFVIPPESKISTYAVTSQCNATIIYGTKTGVELTSMGIPVIVAGEAWIRNKGVTLDANSPREYFRLLDRLPLRSRLSESETQRARKYAYHFFFRRMIPLPFTADSSPEPDVHSLADLALGQNPGLDVICDGILHGSEFLYPAELYPVTVEEDTPVSKEALAFGLFRVADGLGYLGEFDRMRNQLIKALGEFSSVVEESWVRPLITRNVLRLALAYDKPVAAVLDFWQETKALVLKDPSIVSRALADALREMAITLGKQGSYRLAAQASFHALYYDPTQVFQKALLKRLTRAIFLYLKGELAGSRPIPS